MITFTCDKCEKRLEVDDELAGQKVECPFCHDVNRVPAATATAVARPAGSGTPKRSAGGDGPVIDRAAPPSDRPSEMGLPPDFGPEQHVLTVHPALFRARPFRALLAWGLVVGGGLLAALVSGAGLIGGGALAAAGIVWLVVWWVTTKTIALVITNKRTTLRTGLLSRSTKEILHDRVQDIQVSQTFFDRVCRVGRIGLSSSGEAGVEIEAGDLPNPTRIREVIDAYRNV